MEKQQDGLAPFSSDECPNSGEDSDEDVITDYLNTESTECSQISVINIDHQPGLVIDGNHRASVDYTKDNSLDTAMSENNDERRNNPATLGINRNNQQNPLVPIISVTPHSPGLAKHYPVLEDNLQQLHEIHNSIQRMRESTLCAMGYTRLSQGDNLQRLSSSCPSLCPIVVPGERGPGSDPDLANGSNNSSPTHYPQGQLPPGMLGVDRRRSWTDLEESRQNRHRCGEQNHLQAINLRQRSISLSSLDSELDLEIDAKSRSQSTNVANRSCRSQTSTHSLNEADFVQIDPHKSASKRGIQRLTETVNLLPGVTGSRLPLQKSISTPSIIGPPGQAPLCEGTRTTPSLATKKTKCMTHSRRNEKGSGSETENEDPPHSHAYHEDIIREGSLNAQTSLDELMTDGTVYDDHHSEKTRRKRGSLFFRKKKDKSGKKPSQPHHWVPMTAHGNYSCDYCLKQFGNKSVLHCENCGAIVHQNQSCRDQMSAECIKSKNNSHKGSTKSMSSVSIVTSTGHVKRGSTVSLPASSSTGTNRKREKESWNDY